MAKVHFKMYKSGKRWVLASVSTISFLVGGYAVQEVHADNVTVAQSQSVSSETNLGVVNADDVDATNNITEQANSISATGATVAYGLSLPTAGDGSAAAVAQNSSLVASYSTANSAYMSGSTSVSSAYSSAVSYSSSVSSYNSSVDAWNNSQSVSYSSAVSSISSASTVVSSLVATGSLSGIDTTSYLYIAEQLTGAHAVANMSNYVLRSAGNYASELASFKSDYFAGNSQVKSDYVLGFSAYKSQFSTYYEAVPTGVDLDIGWAGSNVDTWMVNAIANTGVPYLVMNELSAVAVNGTSYIDSSVPSGVWTATMSQLGSYVQTIYAKGGTAFGLNSMASAESVVSQASQAIADIYSSVATVESSAISQFASLNVSFSNSPKDSVALSQFISSGRSIVSDANSAYNSLYGSTEKAPTLVDDLTTMTFDQLAKKYGVIGLTYQMVVGVANGFFNVEHLGDTIQWSMSTSVPRDFAKLNTALYKTTLPKANAYTPKVTLATPDVPVEGTNENAPAIMYQKAQVTFVDLDTGNVLKTVDLYGQTDGTTPYTTATDIAGFNADNYVVTDDGYVVGFVFDADDQTTQQFNVSLRQQQTVQVRYVDDMTGAQIATGQSLTGTAGENWTFDVAHDTPSSSIAGYVVKSIDNGNGTFAATGNPTVTVHLARERPGTYQIIADVEVQDVDGNVISSLNKTFSSSENAFTTVDGDSEATFKSQIKSYQPTTEAEYATWLATQTGYGNYAVVNAGNFDASNDLMHITATPFGDGAHYVYKTKIVLKEQASAVQVVYVDDDNGGSQVATGTTLNGVVGESWTFNQTADTPSASIANYIVGDIDHAMGNYASTGNPTVTVHLTHKHNVTTETKDVTQTIHYQYADGTATGDPDNVQKVSFSRSVDTDLIEAAKSTTYVPVYGSWMVTGNTSFNDVTSPVKAGYILDIAGTSESGEVVKGSTPNEASGNTMITVVYHVTKSEVTPNPPFVPEPAPTPEPLPEPAPAPNPEPTQTPGTVLKPGETAVAEQGVNTVLGADRAAVQSADQPGTTKIASQASMDKLNSKVELPETAAERDSQFLVEISALLMLLTITGVVLTKKR